MKLPRWLVVSLLSLSGLGVFGAGAWWWVTWPKRTMDHFVEAVETNDLNAWRRLQGSDLLALFDRSQKVHALWMPWNTTALPRTWMDCVRGHQQFNADAHHSELQFRVERGHVVNIFVHLGDGHWTALPDLLEGA